MNKILKGYQGIFFDKETELKLVELQKKGLRDIVKDMHITFKFGELDKFPDELMNKEIALKLIGYASDGRNSGFQVELPEELNKYYKNKNVAHITVSLGEVDGVKGKPVDTGKMNFEQIDPIEISGQLGYFVFREDRTKSGKVMNNNLFEENSKETTNDLTGEDVAKIQRFKEKLNLGEEIKEEDILGIEDFVYEKIQLSPYIIRQLDTPSLKAVMDGYVELKDAKNILKYANIESISNPEIVDLIYYDVGGELWDFCYGGKGFIEGDDEILGLNENGIQIISNKIADIVGERDTNEQTQTISVLLDIWEKFMRPDNDEINNIKMSVNEIIKKRNEEKNKRDVRKTRLDLEKEFIGTDKAFEGLKQCKTYTVKKKDLEGKLDEEFGNYNADILYLNEDIEDVTVMEGVDEQGNKVILYYYPYEDYTGEQTMVRQMRRFNENGDIVIMKRAQMKFNDEGLSEYDDIDSGSIVYKYDEKREKDSWTL